MKIIINTRYNNSNYDTNNDDDATAAERGIMRYAFIVFVYYFFTTLSSFPQKVYLKTQQVYGQ